MSSELQSYDTAKLPYFRIFAHYARFAHGRSQIRDLMIIASLIAMMSLETKHSPYTPCPPNPSTSPLMILRFFPLHRDCRRTTAFSVNKARRGVYPARAGQAGLGGT